MFLTLKTNLLFFSKKMSKSIDDFYGRKMEQLLCLPVFGFFTVVYIKTIIYIRQLLIETHARIPLPQANTIALFISVVASRFHYGAFVIIFCLSILSLENQWQRISRFLRKNPIMFGKIFPQNQNPKRRMHRASKAVLDALENPTVQTAGTMVLGALAWKALDVYETSKAEVTAKADRESAERIAAADRESAEHIAAADREERRLDRESAERIAAADRESAERIAQLEQKNAELDQMPITTASDILASPFEDIL